VPGQSTRFMHIAAVCAVTVVAGLSAQRPDPIREASDALGATLLRSVRMNGFGGAHAVGQNPSPNEPWPRVQIKSYEAAINYETAAMMVDMTREMGAIPPRGGGAAFNGEQREIQALSGTVAWNVGFAAPALGGANRRAGSEDPGRVPRDVAGEPRSAPADAADRAVQIWLTPHGFLKAAMANQAATRRVAGGTEVSFAIGKRTFTGFISVRHEVTWVRTWVANPLVGDMPLEAEYSNYQKINGVSFPMRIVQRQGEHLSLDLWLFSVKSNDPVDIIAPETVKHIASPPVAVEVQKIAAGLYYLTGGTHHSVAIEMSDHVVIVEAPLDEARSLAVMGAVKELIPNKPIRTVVNTHHHFDHAGGLRTYVDGGATIVTHQANRAYYETAWAAPRTLEPDRLSQSKKTPRFQTFTEKDVLTDGERTIEIDRIANSPHDEGFAMVYLPAEKILVEADAYTPADLSVTPPQAPVVWPATLNLYLNIRRLKLDIVQIVPLHGSRVVTMQELTKAAGRQQAN
jgi:glyoxylase-like metal-dependent hydrolase (beta-lactamase superfamily II)